jgi:TonB family protein
MTLSQQNRALIASCIVHGCVALSLILFQRRSDREVTPRTSEESAPPRTVARIQMPPAAALRQLARPAPAARHPVAAPTPPPMPRVARRDRISIGPPSQERARQLLLRREDDLTAPRGTPGAKGAPGVAAMATPATTPAPPASGATASRPPSGASGLALPAQRRGLGSPGEGGARSLGPIMDAVREAEERVRAAGVSGLAGGHGQQMGPLFFDPEGADFTAWVNHFKNEVYRNWIVPQSVLMGMHGHVVWEFTVGRDGRMLDVSLVSSSGTGALDRAAQNALIGSRLLPLPADFAPAQVTMRVSFYYNERPPSS